jgi:ABC-type glycerol-3-phosphate transport system substrate-binding protein
MNSTDAQQWVISAHTKHPDLAWKVLRYLLEPRWQNEHDRIQGGAPFRASILKSMPIEHAWIMKPNAEEVANGILFSPLIPRSGQFFQVLNKHLVEALLGQATAKEAMDRVAAEANKLAGF